MRIALVLSLIIAAVAALPRQNEPSRIAGGEVATIQQYPFAASLMGSTTGVYSHQCGGTIINNRSILTAARCMTVLQWNYMWRSRLGSSFSNQGGTVFETQDIIRHPNFNQWSYENDIAILRVSGSIAFSATINSAPIAGANYLLADNQPVTTIGWGNVCHYCAPSEQLRAVQISTINKATCQSRYVILAMTIGDSMFCAGAPGGHGACNGDFGGPVIHNGVIVGVSSWNEGCARLDYPNVNALVSVASNWIVANA